MTKLSIIYVKEFSEVVTEQSYKSITYEPQLDVNIVNLNVFKNNDPTNEKLQQAPTIDSNRNVSIFKSRETNYMQVSAVGYFVR